MEKQIAKNSGVFKLLTGPSQGVAQIPVSSKKIFKTFGSWFILNFIKSDEILA